MSSTNAQFDLCLDDSSDGESLFIMKTPKEDKGEANFGDLNLDLEECVDTTNDSVIGSVVDILEFSNPF